MQLRFILALSLFLAGILMGRSADRPNIVFIFSDVQSLPGEPLQEVYSGR